jgi:hypothetical protein
VEHSKEGLALGKNGLAHTLLWLYQAESNFKDLKEARELAERAVDLVLSCPRCHGGHIHGEILTNYANILDGYYETLGDRANLMESIRVGQESLSMFPNQDSSRAIKLTNLANKYKMLYDKSNKVADLNIGIGAATIICICFRGCGIVFLSGIVCISYAIAFSGRWRIQLLKRYVYFYTYIYGLQASGAQQCLELYSASSAP